MYTVVAHQERQDCFSMGHHMCSCGGDFELEQMKSFDDVVHFICDIYLKGCNDYPDEFRFCCSHYDVYLLEDGVIIWCSENTPYWKANAMDMDEYLVRFFSGKIKEARSVELSRRKAKLDEEKRKKEAASRKRSMEKAAKKLADAKALLQQEGFLVTKEGDQNV